MEILHLHYQGDLYRVLYDPDVLVVLDLFWYITPDQAPTRLDYDEIEPELRELIEKGIRV